LPLLAVPIATACRKKFSLSARRCHFIATIPGKHQISPCGLMCRPWSDENPETGLGQGAQGAKAKNPSRPFPKKWQ